MCADKSRADIVEDVRQQLAQYVEYRKRHGDPITYQQALLFIATLRAEPPRRPEGPWRERLSWLDQLVSEEGL